MRVPKLWPCHGVLDKAHNGLDAARLAHAKLARPETRLDVGLEVLDNGPHQQAVQDLADSNWPDTPVRLEERGDARAA